MLANVEQAHYSDQGSTVRLGVAEVFKGDPPPELLLTSPDRPSSSMCALLPAAGETWTLFLSPGGWPSICSNNFQVRPTLDRAGGRVATRLSALQKAAATAASQLDVNWAFEPSGAKACRLVKPAHGKAGRTLLSILGLANELRIEIWFGPTFTGNPPIRDFSDLTLNIAGVEQSVPLREGREGRAGIRSRATHSIHSSRGPRAESILESLTEAAAGAVSVSLDGDLRIPVSMEGFASAARDFSACRTRFAGR